MIKKLLAGASILLLANAALAQKGPPLSEPVDANIVNVPDVNIVGMPEPEPTIVCRLDTGGATSGTPYSNTGFQTRQNRIVCPDGVSRVNVKRIAFSPDIEFSRVVAKFRVTVGFSPAGTSFDPQGFLAIVTDGSPMADVAQPFVIDLTDESIFVYGVIAAFSGLESTGVDRKGDIFFIGTPLP
jgi:hypothetical protein